ncbi:hypothetical protein A3N42_09675 [Klebsiella aerogenes]|nr:hypothetical protein A3N42_09675 [Klebsiella aerogenes]
MFIAVVKIYEINHVKKSMQMKFGILRMFCSKYALFFSSELILGGIFFKKFLLTSFLLLIFNFRSWYKANQPTEFKIQCEREADSGFTGSV